MKKNILTILLLLSAGLLAHAQDVYRDNVVILLDTSGSMSSSMPGSNAPKLEVAKEALREVVQNLSDDTEVGLLIFGGKSQMWVQPLGPRDDAAFFQSLDRLTSNGGTPLGEFMKVGANALIEAREKQYGYGSYRLLIVTDGAASDPKLVQSYAPQIISKGIITDVIGVDMKQDHMLARKAHSYRKANDTAALKQAIREVMAEIGSKSGAGSGAEAFGELEGLPMETAAAMLSALSNSGNQRIGEETPSKPSSPASTSTASGSGGFGWDGLVVFVVILIIVLSWAKSLAKKFFY